MILAGRLSVFIFALLLAYHLSFKDTPQLNGVKDAWMFRVSYALVIVRATAFMAFDVFHLFPVG